MYQDSTGAIFTKKGNKFLGYVGGRGPTTTTYAGINTSNIGSSITDALKGLIPTGDLRHFAVRIAEGVLGLILIVVGVAHIAGANAPAAVKTIAKVIK